MLFHFLLMAKPKKKIILFGPPSRGRRKNLRNTVIFLRRCSDTLQWVIIKSAESDISGTPVVCQIGINHLQGDPGYYGNYDICLCS